MSTPPPVTDRILARRVVVDGRKYTLSTATICGDKVFIEPFECETASTRFVDGTLIISTSPGKPPIIKTEPY